MVIADGSPCKILVVISSGLSQRTTIWWGVCGQGRSIVVLGLMVGLKRFVMVSRNATLRRFQELYSRRGRLHGQETFSSIDQ